jgi:hypothetical protein
MQSEMLFSKSHSGLLLKGFILNSNIKKNIVIFNKK